MTNPAMLEDSGDVEPKAAISFGFTKRSGLSKNLPVSRLSDTAANAKDEGKDFIVQLNRGGIECSNTKSTPKDLVIPCVGNRYRLGTTKEACSKHHESKRKEIDKEGKEAALELLKESTEWMQNKETGELCDNLSIPLTQGAKEKEALVRDLETKAESSTMADYEAVPVQGFGMGMLRGMGFKKEDGIGGFRKKAVACIEPNIRPKGLGLGATRPQNDKNKKLDNDEAVLQKGCYIVVEGGPHKSCYGKVEGLDEETARVVVKLSAGGEVISISENILRIVDKEEHKKYSKIINRNDCDNYKKQQENMVKERRKKYDSRRTGSRSRSRSPSWKRSRLASTWLKPQLRVRLIDDRYKDGKYYNTKVIVEDVVSPRSCVVRTEKGRILEDVDPALCETVIPKREMAVVMVVRGQRRGLLAQVLGRDKRSFRAALQMLPDKKEIAKLDYDDICEFVGDVDLY